GRAPASPGRDGVHGRHAARAARRARRRGASSAHGRRPVRKARHLASPRRSPATRPDRRVRPPRNRVEGKGQPDPDESDAHFGERDPRKGEARRGARRSRAARGGELYRAPPALRLMYIRTKQRAVVEALEDVKGRDIIVYNTARMPSMFERVVIASGDSNRQVKALADRVQERIRELGSRVYGVEGEKAGE